MVLKKKVKEISMFPDTEKTDPHFEDYNKLVNLVNSNRAIFIEYNVPSLKNGKQIFQPSTGKSACCNSSYEKLPDIMKEDKKIRQYLCTNCNEVSSILGKRAILVPSNAHKKYTELSSGAYYNNARYFKEMTKNMKYPLYLGLYFIRNSKRIFDLDNATSTILDLLRDTKWIVDDSADMIIPVMLGYHIDKYSPGVIITVTTSKPIYDYESIPNFSRVSNSNIDTHSGSNSVDDILSI